MIDKVVAVFVSLHHKRAVLSCHYCNKTDEKIISHFRAMEEVIKCRAARTTFTTKSRKFCQEEEVNGLLIQVGARAINATLLSFFVLLKNYDM